MIRRMPEHLVVLRQRTAVTHLAVEVGAYLGGQPVSDPVNEIGLSGFHGRSKPFTRSNSANIRRR